jgi:hypothetical protein
MGKPFKSMNVNNTIALKFNGCELTRINCLTLLMRILLKLGICLTIMLIQLKQRNHY